MRQNVTLQNLQRDTHLIAKLISLRSPNLQSFFSLLWSCLVMITLLGLSGCSQESASTSSDPETTNSTEAIIENSPPSPLENQDSQANSSTTSRATTEANRETGILEIYANGEDFVRQGFTSKDGWLLEFDQVEVHFGEIIAYQTKPAFEPEDISSRLTPIIKTEPIAPQIVDLALGERDAEPIFLGQLTVPTGQYNAITWSIRPEQPDQNKATLKLVGTATKLGKTIQFELSFSPLVSYECGEYVGEKRQGFVSAETTGLLEVTLHFDHLFGDSTLAPDDDLNINAYGFEKFANLAQNGKVTITPENLTSELDKTAIEQINTILSGLGHVGEGHCRAKG